MTGRWGGIKLYIDSITKNKANSVSEGKNVSRFLGCCVVLHGEGIGNPLQNSCQENPMDRGAWWAAVYGVAQSRTRLE